ncbi:MAG: DNA mismatch repair protein MutS [Candidatus Zixiibacteriota bacterium]|nr:MAG: DNA mismatch repair protein MutS [candidate division Zixibacteria bacterium]
MDSPDKLTPLLKQYYSIKEQNPGRILFFRMGDFYELFGDDAVTASSLLGIALTSRPHGNSGKIPLAGIPYHTLNRYLPKMLKAGYNIAVCDQVEDPKTARGIVKREVVEILTPGSITLDGALEEDKPNYLASANFREGLAGLALLDLSTGKFLIDEFDSESLTDSLVFHQPSELLVPESRKSNMAKSVGDRIPGLHLTPLDDYRFDTSLAYNELLNHFRMPDLEGFGLGGITAALGAAGAALSYAKDLKMGRVGQITAMERIKRDITMELDSATIRNLEIVETPFEGRKNSLLSVIDHTLSAGGGRLLRSWILSPLRDLQMIRSRQEAVRMVAKSTKISAGIKSLLKGMPDLERLAAKTAALKVGPRDIHFLAQGLKKAVDLKELLSRVDSDLIKENISLIKDFGDIIKLVESALVDDPPVNVSDGNLFRKGYSAELDRLVEEIDEARRFIHNLQKTEREKTGIGSLKVGFNKVFGYYLEVTKPHLSKVPGNYIRKQTLVSAERFITEELKAKEELILNAQEKRGTLEKELFDDLLGKIAARTAHIQAAAGAVAVIDVIAGFSVLNEQSDYVLPELNETLKIEINECRHPVMERLMPPGKFVPNDVYLDGEKRRMAIITGPNMAGKSTYLRQVGLIVLLAQMGAPVPAKSARIGICDRIFTRVGASDDILRGRSTFMVEMTEAASILNNASDKSLILLDELGRGTSTYDGLAIAWSLMEYLNTVKGKNARTLFATHYHELIELADRFENVSNLRVAVKEWEGSIVFLYKIEKGGCDDSYGVQVAKLAGLPQRLLDRALEILTRLESDRGLSGAYDSSRAETATYQISLFSAEDSRLKNEIDKIDPDQLTPIEALTILNNLKKIVDGKR